MLHAAANGNDVEPSNWTTHLAFFGSLRLAFGPFNETQRTMMIRDRVKGTLLYSRPRRRRGFKAMARAGCDDPLITAPIISLSVTVRDFWIESS